MCKKYLRMREKCQKCFVKFLNPDADEIRGAYMSNDWTSTSRSQFLGGLFFGIFKFIFGLILEFFIFFNFKKKHFKRFTRVAHFQTCVA